MAEVYEVHYRDGTEGGVRTLSKKNHVLSALQGSRAVFPTLKAAQFPELAKMAVYILWGSDAQNADRLTIYIGEGFGWQRLKGHHKDPTMDFWQHFVLFASVDDSLDKTLAHWLEASLVETARSAKRADLHIHNKNQPQAPSLSPAAKDLVKELLGVILVMLDLIGLDAFRTSSSAKPVSDWFILKGRGADAEGRETADGTFLVKAGARAAPSTTPKASKDVITARSELIDRGVLKKDGESYVLTSDYQFGSPSHAAKVLLGHSANGWIEWRLKDGRTMKELRQ